MTRGFETGAARLPQPPAETGAARLPEPPAAGESALHADAVAVLSGWVAPDPRQRGLRDRYLAHLRTHPDGLARDCYPAHLTAGALVLDASLTGVLLNLHGKARRWFAFGGHCEPGDQTLAGAALREATEESGIARLRLDPVPVQLNEHAVSFCDPRGTVHHLDVRFVAVAPDGAAHTRSEESLDVRWWPLDGLPELPDEMLELIALARARIAISEAGASQSTSEPGGGSSFAAADQPNR